MLTYCLLIGGRATGARRVHPGYGRREDGHDGGEDECDGLEGGEDECDGHEARADCAVADKVSLGGLRHF